MSDDPKFLSLKNTVAKLLDFPSQNYTNSFLQRRFETRLRANAIDLKDYAKYETLFKSDPEEQKKLLKELTIHVTHFFRDKDAWDALQSELIPSLIEEKVKKNIKTIRIWSAGCSTGEEPYTIMMCFREALGKEFENFEIKLIANDYDIVTVEKAKAGIYDEQQFHETDPNVRDKYFEKMPDGTYHVKPSLTKNIDFAKGDILSSNKPRNIDLAFCRNTVIYFDMPTKTKFYDEVYTDVLTRGGFFVMGKTETLLGDSRSKFKIFNGRERMFKKE